MFFFNISNLETPQLVKTEKVTQDVYTVPRYDEDCGMGLYLVDEKLYYHTGEKINIFDISNPLDLSMATSMDLLVRMLAGGYDMPVLEEYHTSYPTSPPSLYGFGGYGGYDPYPSLYGYGVYGGYGSFMPPITAPTIMPESTIYIGEVNIEGGLHIGELHLGGTQSSSPYVTASFISPSRGSAFLDFSTPPPNKLEDVMVD